MGDSGASRPNDSRTIGRVAACAAKETASPSTMNPGRRGNRARRRAAIDVPQARSPAVAAAESWNPASATVAGPTTRRSTTAQARARAAVPGRPVSRASRATPAITAARSTDGEAPARTV